MPLKPLTAHLQDNGAHIFFCGLKGMMPGIQEMLERVSKVRRAGAHGFVFPHSPT